ncbi:DUF4097 family beta strand repeat-containing protein [soil metagenome]
MPTFSTPSPIDLAINLQVGRIDVVAGDRQDTVVTVSPTSEGKAVDRRGAEETKVDFDGERLTITGPKPRFSIIGPTESVDLVIELPSGSRFTADIPVGSVRTTGRLGATRVKASTGAVDLDGTGDLWVRAGHGSIVVGSADGGIELIADHGNIRVGTVSGDTIMKSSHGNIGVDVCGGDLDAKLSYGDLEIGKARGSVTAKTAYGSIQVHEVASGSIDLESGYGGLTVGVLPGVPAWLDLSSREGRVRNALDGDGAPEPGEQSVAVRARTHFGDIDIQRAR